MYCQGAPAPSTEFNNLFNDHLFLSFVLFFKYFMRKNWRGGGESLLKNGTIHGYAY